MFVLQSDITIGAYKHVKPHNVRIKKSLYEYVDRAVTQLPASAILVHEKRESTTTVETAKQFAEGDFVNIKLGYNDSFQTEFEGFVSRINFTQPCEIECEGYSYLLRIRQYTGVYKSIQLKALLHMLVDGTGILLDENIPDFLIEKIILEGKSGTAILENIKDISSGLIRIYFRGKTLYAGLLYVKDGSLSSATVSQVKYKLGWNVIKDNNLKYRTAKSYNVTVIYKGRKKDGSMVEVQSGDGTGEKIETKTAEITDVASLQQLADAHRAAISYDGYEGKITAFLQPYCEHGYRALLTDDRYPQRNGRYLVDSIEISYGMQGARRTVGLAFKL